MPFSPPIPRGRRGPFFPARPVNSAPGGAGGGGVRLFSPNNPGRLGGAGGRGSWGGPAAPPLLRSHFAPPGGGSSFPGSRFLVALAGRRVGAQCPRLAGDAGTSSNG